MTIPSGPGNRRGRWTVAGVCGAGSGWGGEREFNAAWGRGLPRESETGQKRIRMPPLTEKRVMPAVAFTSVVRISWFG